jgi:hypothetical protein
MTAVSLAANLHRFMILNGVGRFAQFTRMAFVMVDLNKGARWKGNSGISGKRITYQQPH